MQADGRMRVQQVRKWYQEFKNGQRDICDNYCTGGPRTSRTVVNAAWVEALILENLCVIILDLFTAYHNNEEVEMTIRERMRIQEHSF